MTAMRASAPAPVRPRQPDTAGSGRTVVIRPAPPREPPFDDELTEPPLVGPWDQRLPFAEPPATAFPRLVTLGRPHGLPDPAGWARRLLIGLVECAEGRRPLQQIAAMLSPSIRRGLGTDLESAFADGRPHWLHRASVQTIRADEPADGVAELCATLDTGVRLRALAMRLEVHHGRWVCVRLQLG